MHKGIDIGYLLSDSTGSKECIALARQWLSTCLNDHSTCARPRPDALRGWNPTRLIYVGNQDKVGLRLCEAASLPTGVRYTTLSHCWGTGLVRTTLTQYNITSWLESIPDGELMQTFKDAIEVTRSLGVEYIWIDSLCIIQDSECDWLRESASMFNVYKYSYCNIAATAAKDDDVGCFSRRDPLADVPVRFNFSDLAPLDSQPELNIVIVGEEVVDDLEGPFDIQWERIWFYEISDAPLCHRAWVLQEVCITCSARNRT